MMNRYVPPEPAVVEQIYEADRESREQFQILEPLDSAHLRQVMVDCAQSAAARGNALGILLQRRDPNVFELLPALFEDKELGRMAIRYCRLNDRNTVDQLRRLLDHPRDHIWSSAALALARARDDGSRPRLLDWFHNGDEGHRNVAIQALIDLDGAASAELFQKSWEEGGRDEADRLVLAGALLRLGETGALTFLEDAARHAKGAWAVFAATSVAQHDPGRGFRLMQWLLDHGDSEALEALVMHAWNMARLPHAFTADGVHETRLWIEQQLQEHKS
jgi:hypothetical protein